MYDGVSFGRIGRIVCRIGIRSGLDFLAINDPFIEPDYMVTNLLIVIIIIDVLSGKKNKK